MNAYPFVRCLNPRRIVNPYTGELLVVECGCCPACSLRKSSVNALKCRLESSCHKYSMFLTLTYNNVSLPRMLVVNQNMKLDGCGMPHSSGEYSDLVDITQRLGTVGLVLGKCENDHPYHLGMLSKKVNLPKRMLPHLSKYDAQLFIKRLRRNIERYYIRQYGKECIIPSLRYYLVGEYGPVHFRPHYHVILWFEDDELYKVIRQILYKSWTFGRIDCQKSKGQCSDYVAKYLNSGVSLPSVFKQHSTRPFCLHSSYLGAQVFAATHEKVYTSPFEDVVRKCVPCIANDRNISMWRSLKTFYFPKCKRYSTSTQQERNYAYQVFRYAKEWLGDFSCIDLAREIYLYCLGNVFHTSNFMRRDTKLIDYFTNSCGIPPDVYEIEDAVFYIRAIYMELRLSKHFIEYCCVNDVSKVSVMLHKIDEFWRWNDYQNLRQQYDNIEQFQISDFIDTPDDIDFMYHNLTFDRARFKERKFYRMYKEQTLTNLSNSVKHKKLNDLNRYLEII